MLVDTATDYRKLANGILEAWVQNNTGRFHRELERARRMGRDSAAPTEESERIDLLRGIADHMGEARSEEEARVYIGLLRHLATTR
jgi:hypothetical protein